jgi:hypothetical protein
MKLFAARYAFDGFDLCSFSLKNRNKTTVDENIVNQDGASAALAFTATFLSARQAQLFAQYIQEPRHRMDVKRSRLAVHFAVDFDL